MRCSILLCFLLFHWSWISKRHQQTSLLTPFLKKFTLIQKLYFSFTFGTDWDKNSKIGLTFVHSRKKGLKFWPNFFSHKNGIFEFLYKYIWIFKTSFKKFLCRNFWINWEIYKKLKTVDFINMWLFIFEIEIFNFCICQKPTFVWSGLEQFVGYESKPFEYSYGPTQVILYNLGVGASTKTEHGLELLVLSMSFYPDFIQMLS